jgi:CubicO group peptidase (beta-lactamase class C family)
VAVARAATLPRLHGLIVALDGTPVAERVFRGPGLDTPVNVKSVSKIVIDTLVGIAIDRGVLHGVEQPMLPLLTKRAPPGLDAKIGAITIYDLLSMRAGLERTSGRVNYGPWVMSPNWVRSALTRPFVAEPGTTMLYSTGNTHLLSAILTDATGESTWQLARDWLAKPLKFELPQWTRDPQGIYFGGNEMALSPRALLRIGEMYRAGGSYAGRRIVSENWTRKSWAPRGTDRWGHGYGYGWFISEADGEPVYFGWGFGGQMLYVVPPLKLTVVITSDSGKRSVDDGYVCALHALVAYGIMPAFLPAGVKTDSSLCGIQEPAAGP